MMTAEFIQARKATRRGFLSNTGKLAAAAAIASAFTIRPFSQSAERAMAAHCLDIDGDGDIDDVDVLQYALTLEHLEAEFYKEGQARFSTDDFRRAAAANRSRGERRFGANDGKLLQSLLNDVRDHEVTHVDVLTQVIMDLGGDPVEACKYDFGYSDASGYLAIAQILENTGVMAYTGAINCLENADLVQASATIATVEARHASFLNYVNGDNPFPSAFDEAKTMQEILDLLDSTEFVVSCNNSGSTSQSNGRVYEGR